MNIVIIHTMGCILSRLEIIDIDTMSRYRKKFFNRKRKKHQIIHPNKTIQRVSTVKGGHIFDGYPDSIKIYSMKLPNTCDQNETSRVSTADINSTGDSACGSEIGDNSVGDSACGSGIGDNSVGDSACGSGTYKNYNRDSICTSSLDDELCGSISDEYFDGDSACGSEFESIYDISTSPKFIEPNHDNINLISVYNYKPPTLQT